MMALVNSELGFDDFVNGCMLSLSSVNDFITPEGDTALECLAASAGLPLISPQKLEHLAKRLAEQKFANIYKQIWNDVFLKLPVSDDKDVCNARLKNSTTIMVNLTDNSTPFCQQCLDCCVHQDIFRYLDNEKLAPSRMSDQSVAQKVQALLTILYNIVRLCDSREAFRECQAFTILKVSTVYIHNIDVLEIKKVFIPLSRVGDVHLQMSLHMHPSAAGTIFLDQ